MTGDTALWGSCLAAQVVAGVLAAALGRRDRPVQLVALAAALFVVADLEIALAGELVLDAAPRPYHGLARALYHVETLLLLAQPFFTAAIACRLFAWPRQGAAAVNALGAAWLVAGAAMVIAYPLPIGWTPHALHFGMVAPVVVAFGAAYQARRRPWGRAHALIFFLLLMLLSIGVIGPFVRGQPFNDWKFARISGTIGFGVVAACCAAWLGGWSWKAPSSPSGRSWRSPSAL